MRIRPVLVAVVSAAVLAAPFASAAPKPQIEDPAGDHVGTGDYDLTTVLFDTVKEGGKLKALTITMSTASAPSLGGVTSYNMRGDISGCGTFLMYTYTSALDGGTRTVFQTGGCGSGTDSVTGEPEQIVETTVVAKDKSLIYTLPFSELPKELQKATFSGMQAWTAPAEPVVGYTAADFVDEGAFDFAEATSEFKVS